MPLFTPAVRKPSYSIERAANTGKWIPPFSKRKTIFVIYFLICLDSFLHKIFRSAWKALTNYRSQQFMFLLTHGNQEICTVFGCEKPSIYAGLCLITITLLRPYRVFITDLSYGHSIFLPTFCIFLYVWAGFVPALLFYADLVTYSTATPFRVSSR